MGEGGDEEQGERNYRMVANWNDGGRKVFNKIEVRTKTLSSVPVD